VALAVSEFAAPGAVKSGKGRRCETVSEFSVHVTGIARGRTKATFAVVKADVCTVAGTFADEKDCCGVRLLYMPGAVP
jgi:hypothetical protein